MIPSLKKTFMLVLLAMVLLAGAGIFKRRHHLDELKKEAQATSLRQVIAFNPLIESSSGILELPGNVVAFKDAALYARSPGYLRKWYADIGTEVKTGDPIAKIETPELDQEVLQARSDLATAKANYDLAYTTAVRWQSLVKTRTVSEQDLENKLGDAAAKKAILGSAKAHLRQLLALQSFEQIRAPFDGTLSARNVDIGDLVEASPSGRELFHLVDSSKLRILVQVPQAQANGVKVGMHAGLSVPEHPGSRFDAEVIQIAGGLDPKSRTVLVELLFDNAIHAIHPGDFASVGFRVKGETTSLRIPITALIFRGDGLQVATVNPGHHVHLVTIVPGRDFGKSMEVLSGLDKHASVIDNPPDSITEGEQVVIASVRKLKAEP